MYCYREHMGSWLFLIVELMSWEYVNIWSICCKTKFGWAQHTQRNTKTKRTTIRTQNNARAVSAFNSLSHYMHRDKPPFFSGWCMKLSNTTNPKITWLAVVMLAHTYNPWTMHAFKSSVIMYQESWRDDSAVKLACCTIIWLESHYLHPYNKQDILYTSITPAQREAEVGGTLGLADL